MPRILCDLLSDLIGEQSDMAVLNGCVDVDALLSEIDAVHPDVVVLGLTGTELASTSALVLDRTPKLRIVAVEDDGRCASRVELRPARSPLPEPSVEGFLELIRRAAKEDGRLVWESAPGGSARGRRG